MLKTIKFISVFLVIMLICTCTIAAAAKPTVDVKRGSAVIDGQIDDIWQYVEEMKLDRVNSGEPTDAVVYAKMLWDDENLYILMVANDKTKYNTDEFLSQEDCFEVFFDLNNLKTDAYTEPNQFRFLYDILTPFETGMRNLDNISENALEHIEIAGVEIDTGYIMEVKVNSKVGINFSLSANMEIGIDFGYDDNVDESDNRLGQSAWNSDGTDNVAAMPLAMGTIRLVNEEAMPLAVEEVIEEAPAEPIPTEAVPAPGVTSVNVTSPQTGNMTIIIMCAAFILSGLSVRFVVKRKKFHT
jgi:endo-1,4-beta-xylanase